jgi:hypothetical protein
LFLGLGTHLSIVVPSIDLLTSSALLSGLQGSYKLNEALGNDAVDYSGNANTLTDVGSVEAEAVGKIGGARSWNSGGTQHLIAADGTVFHFTDSDFTISIWARLDDLVTSYTLWAKTNNTSNNRQYRIQYNVAEGRFHFFGSTDGANYDVTLVASNSGAIVANTWYHVLVWYDSVGNVLGVRVNNGTADTLSHSGGFFNGNEPFRLGNFVGSPGSIVVNKLQGDLDALQIWNRVLSPSEQTNVYNSGDGVELEAA